MQYPVTRELIQKITLIIHLTVYLIYRHERKKQQYFIALKLFNQNGLLEVTVLT